MYVSVHVALPIPFSLVQITMLWWSYDINLEI